jgi:hypothetical protein
MPAAIANNLRITGNKPIPKTVRINGTTLRANNRMHRV